jgi:hypothetical protein
VIEVGNLAKKCRRALRNEQGTRFTADEFQALAELGLLEMLQTAEAEELRARWREKRPNTSMAITGSTSGETASPPVGKSRAMSPVLDRSAIAALAAGA